MTDSEMSTYLLTKGKNGSTPFNELGSPCNIAIGSEGLVSVNTADLTAPIWAIFMVEGISGTRHASAVQSVKITLGDPASASVRYE